MTIIKNIIEELIRLVKNNNIKFSFNTFEDLCTITFGRKYITISNFYNTEQKYFYYQVDISDKDNQENKYNIIIQSGDKELFNKTKYLYELAKMKSFESDPYLQSILSELKSGTFETEDNPKISNDNDDLPY